MGTRLQQSTTCKARQILYFMPVDRIVCTTAPLTLLGSPVPPLAECQAPHKAPRTAREAAWLACGRRGCSIKRAEGLRGSALLGAVARALQVTVRQDDQSEVSSSLFDSASLPPITLSKYLKRLHRDFRCSESSFVVALVLLDRFLADDRPGIEVVRLTTRNVHRLFLACAVLAVKFLDDRTWYNTDYAKFGGIAVADLNMYERVLLRRFDYNVAVGPEMYRCYLGSLEALSDSQVQVPSDPFAPSVREHIEEKQSMLSSCSDSGSHTCRLPLCHWLQKLRSKRQAKKMAP